MMLACSMEDFVDSRPKAAWVYRAIKNEVRKVKFLGSRHKFVVTVSKGFERGECSRTACALPNIFSRSTEGSELAKGRGEPGTGMSTRRKEL